MNFVKKFLSLIILIALSYWAIAPFFHPGFFSMHDNTQIARVFEMKKSLSDDMLPVRWVSDLGYGYGYPIFNFYAPLAYYIGGIFNLIGFNALFATKSMMAIGIVLAGLAMYLFAREFWGEFGGIISGLLYVYAPYHAVDIYVRGDVAEFWAYAFIPFIFLAIYKLYIISRKSGISQAENTKLKSLLWVWVGVGGITYAAVITSHNLTAMMLTPFLCVAAVMFYLSLRLNGKTYKPYFIFLILLFGIALSAFYWLPALTEIQYTNVLSQIGGGADYHDHYVCLNQLWNSPWGFGGSEKGCIDGLSFKIGKLHILLSLFSILAFFVFWKKNRIKSIFLFFSFISLAFSIFLMLQQSQFIWDMVPQMAFFQYPWRFLVMVSFFTSFLSGASGWIIFYSCGIFSDKSLLHKHMQIIGGVPQSFRFGIRYFVAIILMLVILFINAKVFVPQTYLMKTVNEYTSRNALTWMASKISDEYMPKGFLTPKNPAQVPQTKIVIKNTHAKFILLTEKTQIISAMITSPQQTQLQINQAYFPGWHVYIDGQQVWFHYFNKGLLVTFPKGEHKLDIRFSQTSVETIADYISLAGVISLVLGIILIIRFGHI